MGLPLNSSFGYAAGLVFIALRAKQVPKRERTSWMEERKGVILAMHAAGTSTRVLIVILLINSRGCIHLIIAEKETKEKRDKM